MKVYGMKIKHVDLENLYILMVIIMKVNGGTIWQMGMENM